MNVTRSGGGLKALAAKLTAVASGAHKAAATKAYAAALAILLRVNVEGHVKTGQLVRDAKVVIPAPGEVTLMGPTDYRTSYSYMHFIKGLRIAHGFRDADKALAMRQYLTVLRSAL